jgi:hypothetical protein
VRTLTEIMNTNRSDKGTVQGEAHGCTRVYERWFKSMRKEPLRVLRSASVIRGCREPR